MSRFITVIVLVAAITANADTFKHRQTGDVFHGFVTQKTKQGKTLVYVETEKGFKALTLAEYEVTRDFNGRRNSVVIIPIKTHEVIISHDASKTIAKTIADASDKGPKCIILEIDNPGGTGEYMQEICTAILKTTNCPVIAYISGGKYGGAYSAASALAIACEKIYIAGDAAMGSLGPVVASQEASQDAEYNKLFGLNDLAGYGTYIGAIAANRGRPGILAKAFLDKSIEVIEIESLDGNRSYIAKEDRSPQDSIVRTISKVETRIITDAKNPANQREVTFMVVSMTADDAVRARLADKVVGSRDEVLIDLGVPDAQLMLSRQVDTAVRKFVANQRNIRKEMVQIDYLQQRVDDLAVQLNKLDEQIRSNPNTVQRRQSTGGDTRGRFDRSYRDSQRSRVDRRSGIGSNRPNSRRRINGQYQSESVTETAAPAGAYALYEELAYTSDNLVRGYRRVIGLAKRDAGALPMGLTVESLSRRLDGVVALQNNLIARYR